MFQFKIRGLIRWGTNFRVFDVLVCFCLKQRRKLLLMMKTKGWEEKWNFVESLCKNLIKRTTWHFFLRSRDERQRKGKFKQSIFYYFLSMKNVIFIQILRLIFLYLIFLKLSWTLQRIFKMKNEIRLEKYKWHFDYFQTFFPREEWDPKLNWWSLRKRNVDE